MIFVVINVDHRWRHWTDNLVIFVQKWKMGPLNESRSSQKQTTGGVTGRMNLYTLSDTAFTMN